VKRLVALYPDARLPVERFRLNAFISWLQQRLGSGIPEKSLTLIGNRRLFAAADAVVVPERTSLILRKLWLPKLRMIWTNHGAPGRAVTYADDLIEFDYVLLAGERQAARMREQGTLREGRYHAGTYAKFDLVARLDARREKLFANDRPTVLYNPHFEAGLSSWPRDGFKVLGFLRRIARLEPDLRAAYPDVRSPSAGGALEACEVPVDPAPADRHRQRCLDRHDLHPGRGCLSR
jgi:hypothetical protein